MKENKLDKYTTEQLIKKNRMAKVIMIISTTIAVISTIIAIITLRRDLGLSIFAMIFIGLFMYRGFKNNKAEIERRKNE